MGGGGVQREAVGAAVGGGGGLATTGPERAAADGTQAGPPGALQHPLLPTLSLSSAVLVARDIEVAMRPNAVVADRPTALSLMAAPAALARSEMRSLWSSSLTCRGGRGGVAWYGRLSRRAQVKLQCAAARHEIPQQPPAGAPAPPPPRSVTCVPTVPAATVSAWPALPAISLVPAATCAGHGQQGTQGNTHSA